MTSRLRPIRTANVPIAYPRRRLPSRQLLTYPVLIFFLLLQSCALFNGITYYDYTTYKNLTENKAEVLALYETFINEKVDSAAVREVRLKLSKMYEYEKGKGETNQETFKQIQILRDIFDRHVNARLQNGKWTTENMQNLSENIADAFDLAISTEALKNKSK